MKNAVSTKALAACGVALVMLATAVAKASAPEILEVSLRVTSPGGDDVSVTTVTDSPVAIQFGHGGKIEFVVKSAPGDFVIGVIDSADARNILDSAPIDVGGIATVNGYRFEVAGARSISGVEELSAAGT